MAIFASTTLGSSDPSRAMSIKALEARAQALAAAQAQQQAPASLPSPWQGAALVANQAVDAFTARQADKAAAQRRSDLAGYMAQAGDNPTPQQLGQITAADSDVGKTYMQEIASRRAAAAQVAAAKEAAATKAASDEAAAVSQEGRVQARPQSPLGQVTHDVGRKPTETEAEAEIKKMTQGSPADQAAMGAARDENVNLQTTAAKLAEADQLLKDGIYHGVQAGNKTAYGQAVPNVLQGVTGIDDATTARSKRYNQIMSSEVVAQLKAIKGPASNKDMEWALSTVNDASAPKENKQRAMTILRAQMDAHLRSSAETLKGMGTAPIKVDIPAAGAPAAGAAAAVDPLEGRTANGPNGPIIRRNGKWEPK